MAKAPTPSYSKARPPRRDGEFEQPTHEIGGDIIIQGNGAGSTEVLAGDSIMVEDLSDSVTDRFRVNWAPYVDTTVVLTIVAKETSVTRVNPIMRGTVIDEVNLSWVRNKSVSSQLLTNNASLIAPTLNAVVTIFDYTGIDIQDNAQFTIQVNDGQSKPGSIATNSKSVVFGNNFIIGNTTSMDGKPIGDLVSAASGFTRTVQSVRQQTYYATGGVNQHHFVLYPKSWGLGIFTKGIFTGGYVRLKNVSGVFKSTLIGGDTEIDFLLGNAKGFSEAYYVYMSLFDNQVDAVTPFIIS